MSSPQNASLCATERSSATHRDLLGLLSRRAAAGKTGGRHHGPRVLDEEGSELVEMALTCGILMTMLIGLFQITLAVYSYHYVSDAAREATRWAIVRGANCVGLTGCGAANSDIQAYVQNLGYPGITPANLTTITSWDTITMDTTVTPNAAVVTPCTAGSCNIPGNQVRVQVIYTMPLNIPFISTQTISISSSSAMVISQ